MVKFVILFRTPDELDNFEFAYNNFLAAVERMPDIQRRQVNMILGSPTRERYYRVLEIYFNTYEALDAALKSEIGQKAGHELASGFEPDTFETYFAEVYEESGGQTPREE
ncbi:MAG TPA: hypothetical protein VHD90_26575 [Phototrophicaceae bacterium]|nr:hypothetical protein [Phototrophicaceae bacterium]